MFQYYIYHFIILIFIKIRTFVIISKRSAFKYNFPFIIVWFGRQKASRFSDIISKYSLIYATKAHLETTSGEFYECDMHKFKFSIDQN